MDIKVTKRHGKRFISPSDRILGLNSPITASWLLAVLANSKYHLGSGEIDPDYREADAIQQEADSYYKSLGPASRLLFTAICQRIRQGTLCDPESEFKNFVTFDTLVGEMDSITPLKTVIKYSLRKHKSDSLLLMTLYSDIVRDLGFIQASSCLSALKAAITREKGKPVFILDLEEQCFTPAPKYKTAQHHALISSLRWYITSADLSISEVKAILPLVSSIESYFLSFLAE